MRRRYRTIGWTSLALATVLVVAGCQGGLKRRSALAAEPSLDPMAAGGSGSSSLASTDPDLSFGSDSSRNRMTWVDRHPMFSKPRDYYNNTNSNSVVKGAAATVVGVPAGLMGEMKQVVVGRPANPAPY
jgi:hypothetical protein